MTNAFNDSSLDGFYTINSELTYTIPCFSIIFNDENSQYNYLIENLENKRENENHLKNSILPEQYTFEKIKKDIFPLFAESDVDQYFKKNDNIINLEKKMSDETYKQKKRGIEELNCQRKRKKNQVEKERKIILLVNITKILQII